MSRKSKRNPPTETDPQPQTVSVRAASSRRYVFIAFAVALLLAFVGAALLYKSEQARASQLKAAKNLPALVSAHAPTFGSAEAKVHLVEFLDPACETCAAFFPHVKALLADNPGRIRLSIRHVPFHQGSEEAVKLLEAARTQGKYLQTMEALYARQSQWTVRHVVQPDRVWQSVAGVGLDLDRLRNDMNTPEVARRMAQDMADARSLGVTKTPEFFVNGRPLPAFGLDELRVLVSEELLRAYP